MGEWLGDVATELVASRLEKELESRTDATRRRAGYLLSGLRPDLAAPLADLRTGKVWFGPRRALVRHDSSWQIAGTILPFDPTQLASADPAS